MLSKSKSAVQFCTVELVVESSRALFGRMHTWVSHFWKLTNSKPRGANLHTWDYNPGVQKSVLVCTTFFPMIHL